MTSGFISVFSCAWFDSVCMFMSVYWRFGKIKRFIREGGSDPVRRWSGMCKARFAFCVVFLSFVDRPRMLCIMVGFGPEEQLCSVKRPCRLHRCSLECCNDWYEGPDSGVILSVRTYRLLGRRRCGLARRRQHVHGWFCWLRCTSRCVPLIVGRRPRYSVSGLVWNRRTVMK